MKRKLLILTILSLFLHTVIYAAVADNVPTMSKTMVVLEPTDYDGVSESFCAWKKAQGFNVILIKEDFKSASFSPDIIRNRIITDLTSNNFAGMSDTQIKAYITIIGDYDDVPGWLYTINGTSYPTDFIYGDIKGSIDVASYDKTVTQLIPGRFIPTIQKTGATNKAIKDNLEIQLYRSIIYEQAYFKDDIYSDFIDDINGTSRDFISDSYKNYYNRVVSITPFSSTGTSEKIGHADVLSEYALYINLNTYAGAAYHQFKYPTLSYDAYSINTYDYNSTNLTTALVSKYINSISNNKYDFSLRDLHHMFNDGTGILFYSGEINSDNMWSLGIDEDGISNIYTGLDPSVNPNTQLIEYNQDYTNSYNRFKNPVVFSFADYTGNIGHSSAHTVPQTFLGKAITKGYPNGAVSFVGPSSDIRAFDAAFLKSRLLGGLYGNYSLQSTNDGDIANIAGEGFTLTTDRPETMGSALLFAFYDLYDAYNNNPVLGSQADTYFNTIFTMNIFGDPSLKIWNTLPQTKHSIPSQFRKKYGSSVLVLSKSLFGNRTDLDFAALKNDGASYPQDYKYINSGNYNASTGNYEIDFGANTSSLQLLVSGPNLQAQYVPVYTNEGFVVNATNLNSNSEFEILGETFDITSDHTVYAYNDGSSNLNIEIRQLPNGVSSPSLPNAQYTVATWDPAENALVFSKTDDDLDVVSGYAYIHITADGYGDYSEQFEFFVNPDEGSSISIPNSDPALEGEYKITSVTENFPSNIDYLVITTEQYEPEVQLLTDFRKSYTNDIITNPHYVVVEDIYDNYITGDITEYSMRDAVATFVKSFYQACPTLKHIFIVGDASDTDFGNGETIIPSSPEKLISDEYYYTHLESSVTATDLLASPIAFGRIAPDTKEEMYDYVQKVISYENLLNNGFTWKNSMLIAADDDTNMVYDEQGDVVTHEYDHLTYTAPYIPDYVQKNYVFMGEYAKKIFNEDDPDSIFQDIIGDDEDFIKYINEGSYVTVYQGHSWEHGLSAERMFTTPAPYIGNRNDPEKLKDNGKPTFMLLGGCNTGDYSAIYDGVEARSIAEQVTLVENGGAIAALASINGTYSSETARFFGYIFDEMYQTTNKSKTTLGAVVNNAKNRETRAYFIKDAHRYMFYGDPAITLKKDIVLQDDIYSYSTIYGNSDISLTGYYYISDDINATTLSISESRQKSMFESNNSTICYLKYGKNLFSTVNYLDQVFSVDALPEEKASLTSTFFTNEKDYVYYKENLQLFEDSQYELIVDFKDEGYSENNFVKPRINIINSGTTSLSDFTMYYYFTSSKDPVLKDWYSANSSVTLESLGDDNYRLVYNYSGFSLEPSSIENSVCGIHYADWSEMDKFNDYSYITAPNYITNDKIVIYKDSQLIYGNPPITNIAPVANAGDDITVSDSENDGFETVTLNANQSLDSDGIISSCKWYLDDELVSSSPRFFPTLAVGHYVYTLEVTDNMGATSYDNVVVNVEYPTVSTTLIFVIAPNPVPANTPITISYTIPEHYIDCEITAVLTRLWDTKTFVLGNTPGEYYEEVFWEWNASYFGGSDVGVIDIVVDGEVIASQSITFLY